MFRGENITLNVRWPNAQPLQQLLPPRNHAGHSRPQVAQGNGGLTGEIPILVALIIYSVPANFNSLDQALRHCFSTSYQTHGLPSGQGCEFRRLV